MELKLNSIDNGQDWVDDGDFALRILGFIIGRVGVKFIVGVAEWGKVSQICILSLVLSPTFRS